MTTDGFSGLASSGASTARAKDSRTKKAVTGSGEPLRILSLGAGVQSTALFILGCEGVVLPKLDAAVFADTQWEPRHVRDHLINLQTFGEEHGVAVYLATRGSLPKDVLDPQVFATIPAWTKTGLMERTPVEWARCPSCLGDSPLIALGDEVCEDCQNQCVVPVRWELRHSKNVAGRVKRQCTPKYKIEVIEQQVRMLLGAQEWHEPCKYCASTGQRIAPWEPTLGEGPCSICRGTGQRRRVGSVPAGTTPAEQWIGFSTDEFERVSTGGFKPYQRPEHPLLDLGWSRTDCETFLTDRNWQAEKSACIGCPFHDDDVWIDMKHRDPEDFADAVAFDENPGFRNGSGMDGARFLHEARIPLREAVEQAERERAERGEQMPLWGKNRRPRRRGCSPYGCRTTEAIEHGDEDAA